MPLPSLSINDVTVTESNADTVNADFTVTLSAASSQTVTVQYATANGTATAGSDYTATSDTLTFTPGGTLTQTISVPVLGDTLDEADETFTVTLSSPTNATLADDQGVGTITDDDAAPTLSINDVTVTEGNTGITNASFTVTLSAVSDQTVTVQYAAANGTATAGSDYTATSGTLTFTPGGSLTQTVTVSVIGDTGCEPDETFTVNLTNPTNATLSDGQGVGTITNNDALPTLSVNDVSITEGNTGTTNAIFTAALNVFCGQTVTVQYATANGTATAGSDYTTTSGTLTFTPGGSLTQTITVPVIGDVVVEPNETFVVNLTNPTHATLGDGQGQGTITNDDTAWLSINDVSATEGNSSAVNLTFTVTMSTPHSQTVTVQYATANGTATAGEDYTAASGTITFIPGGPLTQTITVAVLGDTLCEENETLTVTLSNPANASLSDNQGVGTIIDDDLCPPLLISPSNGALTSDNTPTFVWQVATGAAMYRIQVSDSATFGNLVVDAAVNPVTYTPAAPLADNVTYYWRVQALDGGGQSSLWSEVWSFTVDMARLRAPLLSLPKDRSNTPDQTPTFSWGSVSGATAYQVQVAADSTLTTPIIDVPIATATYTAPELPYGVYYWRVRARDAAGNWSDWSLTRTVTITILSTPTNAQHLTDTTPAFVWKAVTGAAAYHLQVYDDEALSHVMFEFTGTGTTTTPTTPLANSQHWWRMQVSRGAGFGEWTLAWTFTVTPPTTTAPMLTSPTSGSVLATNTPVFTWNPVSGGDHYQIQIDNNDTFTSPAQDETLAAGVLTYTASPLPDGGKFYWRVRALNSAGVAGAWSSAWTFTLQQIAAPVLVSPPNPMTTTDTTPAFTWNTVAGAASYQIQIGTTSSFATIVHQDSAGSNFYTIPGPLPDGRYYWRVRALTGAGVAGKWSAAWVVTIDTTGPLMPVLVTPANNAGTPDTTPTFTWKASTGANQYRLQVANNPGFTGPAIDITQSPLTYTMPTVMPYGVYYWHVQARDAAGNWSSYSPANRFTITLHTLPKDGSATTITQPTFQWAAAPGATAYEFVLDNDAAFSSSVWTYTGTARSTKPSTPLAQGTYYWHVRVNVGGSVGAWMPTWTVIITPPLPVAPVLLAPANAALTNDYTPTLTWQAVAGAQTYQVQIDNTSTFTSPEQDVIVGAGLTSYIASDLPDGLYSWRVRALNSVSAPGAWAYKRTFTVDTIPVSVPVLAAPLDDASSTNTKLALSWAAVTGAARYQLQLDPDPAFSLPVVDAGAVLTYKSPTPLSRNVYYWHVRSVDKAGNVSAWSETRSFTIVAGVTSPLLPTQTPVPTLEPTTELTVEPTAEPTIQPTAGPTIEPTTEPTFTPDSSLTVIESNDPRVVRTGNWTAHDTAQASGGRYLYSSGSNKDTLALTFSGSRVDVIFVQHPALGSFALVLDGTLIQTVNSNAQDAAFGARVSLSMGAGRHTLRIVPVNGVIAMDAFAVEAVVEPPVTPEPTRSRLYSQPLSRLPNRPHLKTRFPR